MEFLLLGDQTCDCQSLLRSLRYGTASPILESFVQQCAIVIKDEREQQSRVTKQHIPDCTSIWAFIDSYFEGSRPNVAVDSALLTFSQLASFIKNSEENPTNVYDDSHNRIIGACTGLLAGATISCSQNLIDLVPVAIEAVRIAFRTGLHVARIAQRTSVAKDQGLSWSSFMTGVGEAEYTALIEDFNVQQRTSPSHHAYISAVSPNGMTVSGPPSTLRKLGSLLSSHGLPDLVQLPIRGPYHAPHLHSVSDIQEILQTCNRSTLESHKVITPILSSVGACRISEPNAIQIFERVLSEILIKPLRWDRMLESAIAQVVESGVPGCNISPIGPGSAANNFLLTALKRGTKVKVSLAENPKPKYYEGSSSKSGIAIVGMSGRFPGAANNKEFWELLFAGRDVHREVPSDRFDATAHTDVTGKKRNTSHTPYGCFIDEPGLFDPRFFNMSPREAAQTDPMHRLALTTAYEALEMSGYVPNRTPSTRQHRIGTFYGQTSDDWRDVNAAQKIDTYFIPGGVRAFAPGRINYIFKFSGPSFSIDTACSSSFAAIQLACTSLWAGDCDTAVAGGLNVMTHPDIFAGLSKGQFLSKKGPCQTFDNDADGYCRGDGVGTVVLKRLEDAQADKDNILGVILSTATNHSADAVSITHPHAETQEFLYKKVLRDAHVKPEEVSYVEMHGTGTQAGDATEMRSVTNVFAAKGSRRRQPLYLGAVKANVGHGEASSGLTSLIKVLLMMEKNTIPPHCGIKKSINKSFPPDLNERNVHIPFSPIPWERSNRVDKRTVFLNNFSAAGGNTAVLLRDGDAKESVVSIDPRTTHVVSVSAKSESSLKRNIENLLGFLDTSIDLPSLAYTTTARRIQHNYRVAIAGSSLNDIKRGLSAQINRQISPVDNRPTDVVFVFTGQGSQYSGLGQQLFETCNAFKSDLLQFDAIAQSQGYPSILPLIDGTTQDISTLSPLVVQLGMTCTQMALSRLWISWGINPIAVLGHSLGEYAALNTAGVLSVDDTIWLVGQRASRLQKSCTVGTHSMLAIKGSVGAIRAVHDLEDLEVACINGPEETVLSGETMTIGNCAEDLSSKGFRCTQLKVPFAFHSSQVDPILESFEECAKGVNFGIPTVPILSPLLGTIIRDGETIGSEYLSRHAREAVNFYDVLKQAKNEKLCTEKTVWVEIGPHPVCLGMVKATLGSSLVVAPSLRRNSDPWEVTASSLAALHLAGVLIDWNEYHREFNDALQLLRLPTYSFDSKNYWLQYTNNWCLYKGDYSDSEEHRPNSAPAKSKLSTGSVHRITKEVLQGSKMLVETESNLSDSRLREAIKGHLVNGTGLCPSSLYADMALTIASYMHKEATGRSESIGINVGRMEVDKPLIYNEEDSRLLGVSAEADFVTHDATLVFYSWKPEDKERTIHAKCVVDYEDKSRWSLDWNRISYLVKMRVDSLLHAADKGGASRIRRGMAYKLFSALVQYEPEYRGMEEVILDSSNLEATSKVTFQAGRKDEAFSWSPYRIDSLAHLSGFIMNANEDVDSDQQVFISHGWESMRFSEELSIDRSYRSYVKMQNVGGKVFAGDVYIFDAENVVAVIGGLKFQGIPRQLLRRLLPPPNSNTSSELASRLAVAGPRVSGASSRSQNRKAPPPAIANLSTVSGKKTSSILDEALKIIAEETAVEISELTDDRSFADMGVDSLLSLTITGKFRESFDFEIPASLFVDYDTVQDLKRFLMPQAIESSVLETMDSSSGSESGTQPSTPELDMSSQTSISDTPSESSEGHFNGDGIRDVIAKEMGVDLEELSSSTELAELGMDSLMSLQILGSFREKTGYDLPSDFLTTNGTIDLIEQALGCKKGRPFEPDFQDPPVTTFITENGNGAVFGHPEATSVLLQGNPRTASKMLHLFPDGSGSATSYAGIPPIRDDVAMYGYNCPYMKTPEGYDCGVEGVSSIYITELRRRQHSGPYYLGGWSAGGIVAYEVALQLQQQGEKVERLVLLDSPCPIKLEPLPSRLHHFFAEIGLLGTGGPGGARIPPWLLPHFESSIKNLNVYQPRPMDPKKAPRTFAIWAKEGVCGKPTDPRPPSQPDDPKSMKWLLNNRKDFGCNGWDRLLGTHAITCDTMDGNHFTMMKEPYILQLESFIQRALR